MRQYLCPRCGKYNSDKPRTYCELCQKELQEEAQDEALADEEGAAAVARLETSEEVDHARIV